MLDQEKFLAMKKLAKDVRKENEKRFESFENESVEDAIKEKDELIENIIDSMDVNFSDGEQGKEEKQIFRANVLIPDDDSFFDAYSNDKNVRNLMNKYSVGIEDIMSKITELNLYSKYMEDAKEEPEIAEEKEDEFVDNMVDLGTKEAESLLDEIEDLSSDMESLNIHKDEERPEEISEEDEFEEIEEPEADVEEDIESHEQEDDIDIDVEVAPINNDIEIGDEIENISSAVSEFVDEYSKVKRELEFTQAKVDKFNSEKEELRKKLSIERDENENLQKENNDLRDEIEKIYLETKTLTEEKEELRKQLDDSKEEIEAIEREKEKKQEELDKVLYEAEKLASENNALRDKIKSMEKTVKQSTDLLKEIYKSIPKKRFNIK